MILVGVCAGVAAYKTCELVRLLVRGGHEVQVVQTPASERFVGPATFAALSRRPVLTEAADAVSPHLDASRGAELFAIAPLTAQTLARLAHGEAGNRLLATALAFTGPVVAAPAMNVRMWRSEAVQDNVRLLARRGVELVGPAEGELAEAETGMGRMAEAADILETVERRLAARQALRGVRVCVTAGGTREPLDAVRFLGNRSSGKMGVALADEAARRGAEVTLVLAPAAVEPAARGVRVVRVTTAAELAAATLAAAGDADLVLMAAAVADYRPAEPHAGKRRKDGESWTVVLEPTVDVLAELGRRRHPGQVLVGFAAEHGGEAERRARGKLEAKRVDAVVVNDVSRPGIGFESDENEVALVTAGGIERVPRGPKRAVAAAILDAVARLPGGGPAALGILSGRSTV